MLWKNAAYAAADWVEASSKFRTVCTPSGTKKTLNMFPVAETTCGTPAALSAAATSARSLAEVRSRCG